MLQSVDMVAEEGDFLSGCLVNVDTTVDKDCAAGSSADVFRAKAGQCFLTVAGNPVVRMSTRSLFPATVRKH